MRKLLFLFCSLALVCVLSSCSVQYEMSGLKKLEFGRPADWMTVDTQDDYTYDFVFNFAAEDNEFEVYLRTVYAPLDSPMKWLRKQRKAAEKKGYYASAEGM